MTLLAGFALGLLAALAGRMLARAFWSFGAQSPADYEGERPAFDAAAALAGTYRCEGVLYDFTGRIRARFDAAMQGSYTGDDGVLREHFRYHDGTEQRREWNIRLLGGGRLAATAGDVVGVARGEQSGNTLRMCYRLRLPDSARGLVVSVTDWMVLTESGAILNRSEMRKFGLKVAELFAVLKHDDAPETPAP